MKVGEYIEYKYHGYTIRKIQQQCGFIYQLVIDGKMKMWDYREINVKEYIDWAIEVGDLEAAFDMLDM